MSVINQIQSEWFHNDRSYKAFLYAAKVTEKLESLRKKGAIIFDGEDCISNDAKWIVVLDGVNSFTGYNHGNVTQMYYGGCHDCESGKLWSTMKETKESYGSIKVVMPKDVISFRNFV